MSRIRQHATDELGKALRFGIIGLAATFTHLVVAQGALAVGLPPVTANVIGFVLGFLAGLLGHYHFTFPGSGSFLRAFRRYGLIALAGFALNNMVLLGLEVSGQVSEQISLSVAILIVPAATFLASRFWGFKPAVRRGDRPTG